MKKADAILKRESAFFTGVRLLVITIFLYLLVILEATFPASLTFFGQKPNFTLTFIVLFSLRQRGVLSLVLSAVTGLFLDFVTGKAIPIDGILYLYISFWCVWIQKRMYIEGFRRCTVAVFLFTVLEHVTEAVFLMPFFGGAIPGVSVLFFRGVTNVLSIVWIRLFVLALAKERGQNLEKNG